MVCVCIYVYRFFIFNLFRFIVVVVDPIRFHFINNDGPCAFHFHCTSFPIAFILLLLLFIYTLHILVVLLRSIASTWFRFNAFHMPRLVVAGFRIGYWSFYPSGSFRLESQVQRTHGLLFLLLKRNRLSSLFSYRILASTYHYYYLKVDNKTEQRSQTLKHRVRWRSNEMRWRKTLDKNKSAKEMKKKKRAVSERMSAGIAVEQAMV